MRDITSEPPKRCGFSNDVSAISSPVSRFDEPQDHGRRAQIHGDAVNGAGGARNFNSVEQECGRRRA
jgi:hypothetical protein